jgi:glucokinase
MSATVPVLEIGGSHALAGLVDWSVDPPVARVTGQVRLDPHSDQESTLSSLAAAARSVPLAGGETWVVAVPGPFDYQRGISLMTYQTVGKFESLYGLDLRQALTARLPAPPSQILFVNDADAFGLGQATTGAGAGLGRLVGLTLGTGIGSCFIAGGKAVSQGPGVPPEGRLNFLTYQGRPVEETVSSRAIVRRFAEAGGDPAANVARVAQLAKAGDQLATSVFSGAMYDLGQVVAPSCDQFGAEVLVLGGGMTKSWRLIEEPLRAGLIAAAPNLADMPVKRARPGPEDTLIGAATLGR